MFIYSQPVVLYVTKKKKNKTFEMMLSRMRQFLQISDCLGITKLALKSNILLHRQIEKSHDKILSYSKLSIIWFLLKCEWFLGLSCQIGV